MKVLQAQGWLVFDLLGWSTTCYIMNPRSIIRTDFGISTSGIYSHHVSIGTIPTDDLNPMFFITQKWIKIWAENWILKHSCWWQYATTGFELWTKQYTKFRSGEYSRVNWAKTLCAINLPLSSPAWTSFLLLNSPNFLLLHMATGHSLIAAHLLLKEGDNIAWKIVWIKRLR